MVTDDTVANDGATADTVVIVTHGLTARLFLMRWFHLTVDQFHSLYNMGNCERYNLELRHDARDARARYMITHPLRAGGQFPPPCRCATHAISTATGFPGMLNENGRLWLQ